MKNMLYKDLFRDIKNSKGRYLSILCIVALGVAFFAGIKSAPIVMETTADKYYDDYNLMDIRVLSTLGLTNNDVKELKKIDEIEGIFPTYSIDTIVKENEQEKVAKIHALPLEDIKSNNSKDYINRVNVVEGRLPSKTGECVVEKSKMEGLNLKVGETINLYSGTSENLKDKLKTTKYKVVGIIETPYYLSYEKGSSSIGNGRINGIIMIPQEDFEMDAYNEIFLTLKDVKKVNSYSEEYSNKVDKASNKIEDLSKSRIEARYDEVVGKANEDLEKGKKEFKDKKSEVNNKLEKAQQDLNTYNRKIVIGEKTLKDKKDQAENQIANGKEAISKGEKDLDNGYKQYEDGLKTFSENKLLANQQFAKAEKELDEAKKQIDSLNSLILSLEESKNNPNLTEEEKNNITLQIEKNKQLVGGINSAYQQGTSELEAKKQELNNAENKLIATKITLDKNKEKLLSEKQNLSSMELKSKQEFRKAQKDLTVQKNKINEAQKQLDNSKVKAEDELFEAQKKLEKAQDKIDKIEKPEWYVLDRNSNYSYVEYKTSAEGIDKVSNVFPVFFFCVAALVCLTTMTRMVDEQRINIGTLKALGYTTLQIAKKYILYALSASLLGSIIGSIIGCILFPSIVFNAYGIMYTLPPIKLVFDAKIIITVTIVAVGINTIATIFACYNEVRETPSVLMRPKSPKLGKRILLERIPFIWNKIGFIGKVTLRNIFRYKKRFLMTVLGIAGCSALILTGLGIQDSIQVIVDGQFGSIFKYDMSTNFKNDIKPSDFKNIDNYLSKESKIEDYQIIGSENGKIAKEKGREDITILSPEDRIKMEKLIHLKERTSQNPIKLEKQGIVVSEKVAKLLNVKINDEVQLINSKDKKATAKVIGIAENYVGNYAYISKEYYKEIFNRDISYNGVIATINDKTKQGEDYIAKKLMEKTGTSSVNFNTELRQSFKNTIKSLNYVVLVMTLSAGVLAFVVLYNLTNVNISERIREIATIKVLGFYDKEVSAYIYRENIVLTIIGAIVGLGLGAVLHQFVMVTLEPSNLMFGRIIQIRSCFIAFTLTVILGFIVNFAMYYKLKRVKMVESLKSVD
ncbi:FtsX-like permease family protein [Romboutsia sp.]|uniref:FtsX-like permease family protein n=1 Tax=Romboutsia sp. TaxID=1965302 RepID=UPI003F2DBA12